MNIVRNLFGRKERSGHKLKYSSAQKEWQVYNGTDLLYVGGKEQCESFLNQLQA
jgi:hypothetical protein